MAKDNESFGHSKTDTTVVIPLSNVIKMRLFVIRKSLMAAEYTAMTSLMSVNTEYRKLTFVFMPFSINQQNMLCSIKTWQSLFACYSENFNRFCIFFVPF